MPRMTTDSASIFNAGHYADPTAKSALDAIAQADHQSAEADAKAAMLVRCVKDMLALAGFRLGERVVLVHEDTGRMYR